MYHGDERLTGHGARVHGGSDNRDDGLEKLVGGLALLGEGPHEVRERLLIKRPDAQHTLACDGLIERASNRRARTERRCGPREVGQPLLIEISDAPRSMAEDGLLRLETRRVARRGERPHRDGEALGLEVVLVPHELLRERVEHGRRRVLHVRKGPQQVGDALRLELMRAALRLGGDRIEELRRGYVGRRVRPRCAHARTRISRKHISREACCAAHHAV